MTPDALYKIQTAMLAGSLTAHALAGTKFGEALLDAIIRNLYGETIFSWREFRGKQQPTLKVEATIDLSQIPEPENV